VDKAETIKRFIRDELQTSVDVVPPDYPLIVNKVIDSMGIMEVLTFIENEFGVAIEDEDFVLDNFESISAMVAMIDSKLAAASN